MKPVLKQTTLFEEFPEGLSLKSPYLTKHMITYIGNKRKLLQFINETVVDIKQKLNKEKVTSLDAFSGSGVVSRLLKYHSSLLISNDLEDYTETINTAYLANKSSVDLKKLQTAIDYLNKHKHEPTKSDYFISKNYAPKDDTNIQLGERVFYTTKNANAIDNIRYLIDTKIDKDLQVFCLANLLIKASIHVNTSGVFKGFHKKDGIGHYGGKGENALQRITADIVLDMPLFSDAECEVKVYKEDTNVLVKDLEEVDIAYLDPPYNQHPYGSNYFMLNIINNGVETDIQDGVSGIAVDWNRSDYNKREPALKAMDDLIESVKAKYIVISYNNEGIIPVKDFKKLLTKHGEWHLREQEYDTYKGSRNLRGRSNKVKELLWVLRKS